MIKENSQLKSRIETLEKEIESLKKNQVVSTPEKPDKCIKEYMELRLQETLAEAKRHYNSYVDIREQYNSFVQGRINQTFNSVYEKQAQKSPMKTGNGPLPQ